jgi:hypothetical protein
MKKELVDQLTELELVERVKESEIQGMDLSQPILLLKLTSKFLVVLYQSKRPESDPQYLSGSDNLGHLGSDVRSALKYWLNPHSEFGRQHVSVTQEVQNQIDLAVEIISKCFVDMWTDVQRHFREK